MCGIAGIFDLQSGRPVEDGELQQMLVPLSHRGPDARGTQAFRGGGFGANRLAVIDPGSASNQPFAIDEGRYVLTYNGEVYNHPELRSELIALGHRFRTRSDTEVVIRAYKQWGSDAVRRFNGMWAFAIFDAERDELFCSRDRFGIKPFYFTTLHGQFLFASEIKALLAVRRELAVPNYDRLSRFLRANHSAESETTFFGPVSRLLPAHNLVVRRSGHRLERFWSYPTEPLRDFDSARAAEQLRALLIDSLELRMRSDVPVGTLLSGGLDSSALVALLRHHAGSGHQTFSASFPEDSFDEAPRASELARRFGMQPNSVITPSSDLLTTVGRTVYHMDAPNGFLESVPLWHLLRESREKVVVTLAGEGADELLAGYEWSTFPALLLDRLRKGQLLRAFRELNLHIGQWGAKSSLEWLGRSVFPRVHQFYRTLRGDERLYVGPLRTGPDAADTNGEKAPRFCDALTRTLHHAHTVLLRALLQMDDAVSMAHSIEMRVPFLDHRLVEFGFRLPGQLKARDGYSKIVLRDAVRKDLPPDVLQRRRKNAFETPVGRWFCERPRELVLAILLDERCRKRGLFDTDKLESMVDQHVQGRFNLSPQIFRWVTTELWFREFIDLDGGMNR